MRYGLTITEKLIKANKENLAVKLSIGKNTALKCKVVKLLGAEIEVMINKLERRKIVINRLNGVDFVDEYVSELE